MAEGKKSFILYADQRGIFDKLSDEQAGKLIKHIYSYVNDENPEGDFVTELAFESIKTQLKRDLKKYERYIEKQRENGKKGGRPKNPKKPKPLSENPAEPRKADNDNASDNDNVTVNEFSKENKDSSPFFENEELNKWFVQFLKVCEEKGKPAGAAWIESQQMKLNALPIDKAIAQVMQSATNGWVTLRAVEESGSVIIDLNESKYGTNDF